MTNENTEMQTKEENLPAELMDQMYEDAGAGQEEMNADDMQIPRLTMLQALSPQVQKTDGAYIVGAEPGMIMDSVSLEIIDGDKGIIIVPCSYRKTYIEWKLRENSGGGFVADHGNQPSLLNACEKDIKNRMINADGNQIVATAEYYVLLVDPKTGAANPALLGMSATQLKHSRRWNTMINSLKIKNPKTNAMFNPAMFYRSYLFQTMPESNDQGSWFGWKITGGESTISLPDGQNLYVTARNFREQIGSGEVKVHNPDQEGSINTEDDEAPM